MYKKLFQRYIIIIATSMVLTSCGFKPMDHQYNTQLEKIKIGMSIAQIQQIFPGLKLTMSHGAEQTYQYTEHDYRAISFSGTVKRTVIFHLKHGKLTRWSSDKTRPM
jgi:hypothetical protein